MREESKERCRKGKKWGVEMNKFCWRKGKRKRKKGSQSKSEPIFWVRPIGKRKKKREESATRERKEEEKKKMGFTFRFWMKRPRERAP